MFKMCKAGIVRYVATEAEAQRWRSLGYSELSNTSSTPDMSQEVANDANGSAGLDTMSADELKEYAVGHDIDIGNATSASGILKKIRAAQAEAPAVDGA